MAKTKILVVEDNGIMAEQLQQILKRMNYDVPATADSGAGALKEAEKHSPDLVLMDIKLKGDMDGIETAEAIRRRFNVPVIFTTAYVDDKLLKRAKVTEPYGYVMKPFDEKVLKTNIEISLYKAKIDDELKKANKFLQNILDSSSHVSIIVTDVKHNILYWNTGAENILGYKAEEMVNRKKIDALYLDEDLENEIKEIRSDVIDNKKSVNCDIREKTKDGRIIWVNMTLTPRFDEKGCVTGILGIGQDITESKRAEEGIRASEKLYRSLFENMLNGFAYCRMLFEDGQPRDFIYLTVNDAFETLTGLKNVVGKKISEVIPGIRRSDPGLFEIYGRVSMSGKPERVEIYLEALQQWFWISVYSPATGYFVAVFDVITERKKAEEMLKESEEKYRTLVENIPQKIFFKDRNSVYVSCNENYADDLKIKSDEIRGKTDYDFFPKELAEKYKADDKKVMDADKTKDIEEKYIQDGREVFVHTIKTPVRDGEGRVIGILGVFWDITERKKAEESLNLFQALVNQSNDAIEVLDPETGRFLDVNEKGCMDLGYSREEFLSLRVFDIDPTVDQSIFKRAGEDLQKSGAMIWEGLHRRKDGSTFPVEVNIKYVQLDRKYMVTVVRNITDRKNAEESLVKSEAKYRELFESSRDAIMTLFPPAWKFTSANESTVKMFNARDEKEFISKGPWEVSPEFQPDGETSSIKAKRMIDTAMEEGSHFFEWDHQQINGEVFSATVLLTRIELDGKAGLQATVRDVTQQKKAEEELKRNYEIQSITNFILHHQAEGFSLQSILEEASKKILSPKWLSLENKGAIFLTSDDGKKLVLKVQSCLSEFLCTKCKEVNFGECMCGRAALSGKVEFSNCLDERHTVKYEGIAEHGHYCVPIVSNGKTLGVINTYLKQGHIRNKKEEDFLSTMANILAGIIERKKSEQEKENLQLQLLKSAKLASIGELASGLAHEIGNPLQTILGNADLLLMDNKSEEILSIKNASLHCKKIIEGLLDFSRQKELVFAVNNINDLLEKTLLLYGKQLELKGIKVGKKFQKNIPNIKISAPHIEQVFLNIITNAQKAMPAGGTLTIRTEIGSRKSEAVTDSQLTANGSRFTDFIEISFKDTGVGIPRENLTKLFEPFFTTRKDGTGIGLSISYGIVKQHGGEIVVSSDGEGKGTEFIIKLPVESLGGG